MLDSISWWLWPIVLYSAGIIFAMDALWRGRTAPGTVAWVMGLALMPLLAIPLYIIIGSRKFKGYRKKRRHGDNRLISTERNIRKILKESIVPSDDITSALESLFRVPMMNGNDCELLINGKATFDGIFAALDTAKHTLCVQFYTFSDDSLGQKFADILCQKAQEGIRVYLVYDEIGSGELKKSFLKPLRKAGVEVTQFNPLRFRNRANLNFRNHRKLVIIDGHTTFVGGHNVGNEYLGLEPKFGHWRDTHMRITGPSSLGFQMSFSEDWNWATGFEPDLLWDAPEHAGHYKVMCINTGPADYYETGSLFFTHMISQAKQRCWIVSPYFVPDQNVFSALQLAGLRGVDVRILLPANTDSWMVQQATRSYVASLTRARIQFYTYTPGFLHQKVMLIDNEWSTVGSANMDNRSLRINFEICALIQDQEFATQVEAMLLEDFAQSIPTHIDERWHKKLLSRLLRLISPLL
ncbi:MAG: cardiolipin synthase [Oleibacter sp.]|nr:cardiolipin synthase [Thalassolituus sp.]